MELVVVPFDLVSSIVLFNNSIRGTLYSIALYALGLVSTNAWARLNKTITRSCRNLALQYALLRDSQLFTYIYLKQFHTWRGLSFGYHVVTFKRHVISYYHLNHIAIRTSAMTIVKGIMARPNRLHNDPEPYPIMLMFSLGPSDSAVGVSDEPLTIIVYSRALFCPWIYMSVTYGVGCYCSPVSCVFALPIACRRFPPRKRVFPKRKNLPTA